MFRIKICGITQADDALVAARAGADAIGLNFYRRSSRYIGPHVAAQVAGQLPREVLKVGVFVNATLEELLATWDEAQLDAIQLHGDETAELNQQLQGRPIIKAFRLQGTSLEPVREYLRKCESLQCMPAMVLLDAYQPNAYGGTGERLDWNGLKGWSQSVDVPLVLAGGLTDENVAAAIAVAHPSAVDTASGVELSPGRKDAQKIERFVCEAARAFAAGQ